VRCPEPASATRMNDYIRALKEAGDSTGGVIRCRVEGCPAGWGEPVFDKLHADLGKAILSINACKGFDIGSGFEGALLRGSEHNDPFIREDGAIRTAGNRSGGIQGGISNGMPILFRAAFKPVATIRMHQSTLDQSGRDVVFSGTGRHDPCVVPRAVPIVEAMTALVLCDHYLRQKSSQC
jgi:chorismate synthase